MAKLAKYLIVLAGAAYGWGGSAFAQGDDAPPDGVASGTGSGSAAAGSASAVSASDTEPSATMTDAQLLQMANSETIQIYDERPDKPFDRDTEVRLTGEQLAARGAVDLATALELIPDVQVQDAGRGGASIIIRGASKGQVSILIDGVLVSDPYYGTFDLTSVPITDIVQIRVSTTPQSPIDGPGGPGGVIEVLTRDAVGPQLVIARATSDSLPSFGISATGRAALAPHLALRLSASGEAGDRSLALAAPFDSIAENRRDSAGAARLEYRRGDLRVALDGFADDRHYLVPPADTSTALLLIDRENNARVSAKLDDKLGKYQVQAEAWYHYLLRHSLDYTDPTFGMQTSLEDLTANRIGAMALVTHPIGKEARWAASINADHDAVDVAAGATKMPTVAKGDLTILEAAGDLQYEHRTVRLDGSAGVAVPFGVPADAWPEVKLVAHWRPHFKSFELVATAGRKGRVPSLRERFEPGFGNPALGPEIIDHAELRGIEDLGPRLRIEVAPFYRYQQGTIVGTTQPPNVGMLVNLGTLDLYGIDVLARVRVQPWVEVGASYDYVHAHSSMLGDDPLSHLPRHRADAWVQVTAPHGLSGLARFIYNGDSFINQTELIPAYTTFELTATWQIDPRWLVVARGLDLADARPEIRPGVFGAGRTVSLVLQRTWQ